MDDLHIRGIDALVGTNNPPASSGKFGRQGQALGSFFSKRLSR